MTGIAWGFMSVVFVVIIGTACLALKNCRKSIKD